jgi:hypothetical protein
MSSMQLVIILEVSEEVIIQHLEKIMENGINLMIVVSVVLKRNKLLVQAHICYFMKENNDYTKRIL